MDLNQAHQLVEKHVIYLIDICPHCDAKTHIEKQWSGYHHLENRDIEYYILFKCKPCKKLLVKTLIFEQNKYQNKIELEFEGWKEKFPVSLDSELSKLDTKYIPEDVLKDYEEALKCKSIRANRASCAMFRRSLQSSLVELGAKKSDDLIVQIDKLESLSSGIKDWAHQIRIFGNWGAHPDKDNLRDVGESESIEAHDFISKFFTYMFIMPRKVEESRKKRAEKINLDNSQKK